MLGTQVGPYDNLDMSRPTYRLNLAKNTCHLQIRRHLGLTKLDQTRQNHIDQTIDQVSIYLHQTETQHFRDIQGMIPTYHADIANHGHSIASPTSEALKLPAAVLASRLLVRGIFLGRWMDGGSSFFLGGLLMMMKHIFSVPKQ